MAVQHMARVVFPTLPLSCFSLLLVTFLYVTDLSGLLIEINQPNLFELFCASLLSWVHITELM